MMYGESKVGTEATPTMEHEIFLRVLDRDGDRCLVCGEDEQLKVVKRYAEWRTVPENLYTVCSGLCDLQRGTSLAQANGWTVNQLGVGDRPFLTRDGWKWLGHGADFSPTKPKVFSP